MKSFNTSVRICIQNIRKWGASKRIWMSMALAVIFVYSYTKGLTQVSEYMGEPISPWIFPFLMTYRYMKIIFMAPILFIFCDAPFIDENQAFVMLRTKRRVWGFGQVLYILAGSFLYIVVLILSTILVQTGHISWSGVWGNVLGRAGTTSILSDLKLTMSTVSVSGRIISYFSPIQALFFSVLLQWLSMVFLGLLIYVLNSVTNTRMIGLGAATFFVLFTAVADGNASLTWFSPISWNSLNLIDIGGMTAYPTISYILGMYTAMIIILAVIAVLVSKHQVIEVKAEV